ncbi:MAG: hypothetical protein KF726_23570 [Anaerolineae bacterium]|nr:hypothetical protein [Anaerolineae bacterium]
MSSILLTPPLAFLLYLVLVGTLAGAGWVLAGRSKAARLKGSAYASGEAASTTPAAPGGGSSFGIALFFAVLHLSVLMLGSSTFVASPLVILYLLGVMIALIALILG